MQKDPIDWWFPNRKYQRFWFHPSVEQDKEIYEAYIDFVLNPEFKQNDCQRKILSNILIYDQFSRQCKRISDKIRVEDCDKIALKYTKLYIDRNFHADTSIEVEKRLFALLPLRHTFKKDNIQYAIDIATSYLKEDLTKIGLGHVKRFINASNTSLNKVTSIEGKNVSA